MEARIGLKTWAEKTEKESMINIEISDNGMGIEPHNLDKIFDPFFSTKEPEKGTGLGLTISKSIIEQFKGTIKIKSIYRQGTTVTICLPILEENL